MALHIANTYASLDKKVAIFTLEMDREEVFMRMVSPTASIDMGSMLDGKLNPDEAQLMENLISFAEQADERYKEGKNDEAYTLIRDGIQQVRSSNVRIAPELISGMGQFVEDTPGNLRMRKVRPEENIGCLCYVIFRIFCSICVL